MTTTQGPATAAAAVFLGPGEGPALRMGSLPLVFKALPEWSGGAYEMHEHRIGAGVLVAPHIHAHPTRPTTSWTARSAAWWATRSSR